MEDCKTLDNSIEDKKILIENITLAEINQNLPKLRESDNSTCSVATTITSDNGENVQSCGSVCVFNLQQKLIFNCEFCDLKYGDLDNFRRHLHEAHNLFQPNEELEKENGSAHKISTISTIVKKEPLEPPIDLPSSYFTEALVSCGNAFILNQEKFLMACGYCNCSKYEKFDMFEKHIKQQHNILEGAHNELNVVPKVEVKEEEFIDTELDEAAEIKHKFSEEEGEDENEDENEFLDEEDENDGEYEEDEDEEEDGEEDEEESEDQQSTSKKSKRKIPITSSSSSKKTKMQLDEPSKNPEVECEICHKRLKRQSLNYHRKIHMGESGKIYNCQHCGKKFFNQSTLNTHTNLHTGVKLFECEYCEKKFVYFWHLKAHINTHTREKSYKCDVCRKHFQSHSGLHQHRKFHMGESAKIHNCQQCDMKYIRLCDLKQHLTIHTGEKPFECDICHNRFRFKNSFYRHKQTHLRGTEKKFHCRYCEMKFLSDRNLRNHLRTYIGEGPVKCDICHKRFRTNSYLKSHKIRHTGETGRIHNCEQCDKKFCRKTELISHIHTARHDFPHKCNMCTKRFQTLEKLNDHEKNHIGQGERTFNCEHCNKKFKRSSVLKVHLRIHTGEKPYKCEYCDKRFRQNIELLKHMRVHTKENPKLS